MTDQRDLFPDDAPAALPAPVPIVPGYEHFSVYVDDEFGPWPEFIPGYHFDIRQPSRLRAAVLTTGTANRPTKNPGHSVLTTITNRKEPNPMASIRDVYRSSDTLAAGDLPAGVQVPVVIEGVRAVKFDDGNKLELRFRGKQKVLLCNKTNAMRIADQHGDDYDAWPGKLIYIQRDKTEFKGQLVDCVRVVRQPMAVQQASQLAAERERCASKASRSPPRRSAYPRPKPPAPTSTSPAPTTSRSE